MTITRLLKIIGLFVCLFLFLSQVVDLDLMQAMKATIRKRSKLKAKSATDIEQQQMFKMKYPTWTKILTSFGDEEINCALAEFLVLIIEHTEGLFKLAPERQPEDYDETVDGEIDSQLFPNFPILRQRAYYEKECQAEDEKSLKSMCEKISQPILLFLLG